MDIDVIIVGAGPVGLMLAAELRLHRVGVVVLETLDEPSPVSKAFGLHPRSVETLELRGLVERFEEARAAIWRRRGLTPRNLPPVVHFAGISTVRLDTLDTNHPRMLALSQPDIERVLADWAEELGVEVRRGRTVVGLDADEESVTVHTGDGDRLRAGFVVGCDGGRSTVRRLGNFGFAGSDPTITGRYAEFAIPELLEDPGVGWHRLPGGAIKVLPGRVITVEFDGPVADRDEAATPEEMAASIRRITGRQVELPSGRAWITRFTDNTRLADHYRRGRMLLAGDSAHVHSPFGGQGLNLGLQDAVNLGWKLAATVTGWAPEELLDTYTAERRPVAARILANTRAQVALMNPDPRTNPLYDLFTELLELEPVNAYFGNLLTGLDISYDLAGEHPLTGRFTPDLAVLTATGAVNARRLCAAGRPVLLDLGGDPGVRAAAEGYSDRIDLVTATTEGSSPSMLIRPDGYLAWAGSESSGLRDALSRWFGVRQDDMATSL